VRRQHGEKKLEHHCRLAKKKKVRRMELQIKMGVHSTSSLPLVHTRARVRFAFASGWGDRGIHAVRYSTIAVDRGQDSLE
jgi:hypothetical protein